MIGMQRVTALRLLASALLMWASVPAHAFPFEVEEDLAGLNIAVSTGDLGDNVAAVTLDNYGQVDAQCRVRFRSGPELPVTRKVRVAAQQRAHVTASFNHQVIRMRVQVNCQSGQR